MFQINKKLSKSLGRAGVITTPHGEIQTPAFVAVGTKASVKSLAPEQIKQAGSQVVLGNTYHLLLQPGEDIVREAGGLHKFMNWDGPMMTDSGGFQAFSLGVAYGQGIGKFINADAPEPEILAEGLKTEGKSAKVTEEGVEFKSIIDGSTHFLSPEKSIQIQNDLGADIIFALDEFTSPHADYEKIKATIERTQRWAGRCLEKHKKNGPSPSPSPKERGDHFGWNTADKESWRKLQEQANLFRKTPTQAEEILWNELRGDATDFHFRRQHLIGHFIIDFVCLSKGLIIEVDGDIHDLQKERDLERTNFLEQNGFKVMRFKNEEVINNVREIVNRIIGVLKALPLGEGWGGASGSPLSGRGLRGEASSSSLFGIVQGGRHEDLRKMSARQIAALDFEGFGIGGTFVKEDMATAVAWVNEILPEEKPRHLLGVGEPLDLFLAVENGCDTFDCVAPTRMARNGGLHTKNGQINITNAKYKNLFEPIESGCACYTCQNFTCAYLNHLFKAKEMLAASLASIHNLYFLNSLVNSMREAILEEKFFDLKESFFSCYK